MNSRRQTFMLAGALTATVFTAAAAFAGVSHRPTPTTSSTPAPTPIVQVVKPQAQTTRWADD